LGENADTPAVAIIGSDSTRPSPRFQLLLAWPLLSASIRSRVEVHRFLETLEGMSASLVEAKTRPGDQILDGSRYQYLTGSGERQDARCDVYGDALHIVIGHFDLAGMEATADLDVERTNRLGNGTGAAHGARRETVARKSIPRTTLILPNPANRARSAKTTVDARSDPLTFIISLVSR
jgi:hypothetical protein